MREEGEGERVVSRLGVESFVSTVHYNPVSLTWRSFFSYPFRSHAALPKSYRFITSHIPPYSDLVTSMCLPATSHLGLRLAVETTRECHPLIRRVDSTVESPWARGV